MGMVEVILAMEEGDIVTLSVEEVIGRGKEDDFDSWTEEKGIWAESCC